MPVIYLSRIPTSSFYLVFIGTVEYFPFAGICTRPMPKGISQDVIENAADSMPFFCAYS